MTATFIERCIDPYAEDGGQIDIYILKQALLLSFCGAVDVAFIKTLLSLTEAQALEFDAFLTSSAGMFTNKTRWVNSVHAILFAGSQSYLGFQTAAEVEAALNALRPV